MPEPLTVTAKDLRWAEARAKREADSYRSPFSQDFPGNKAKTNAAVLLARADRFRAAAEAMEWKTNEPDVS